MNFTIQQKVIVWQQFDIEADNREDAIAKITEDPTCGSMDNNGIETLFDTEQVLTTVVYNENATDENPFLILHPTVTSEAAALREWVDWFNEWNSADNPGEVENPDPDAHDTLLGIVYRTEDKLRSYTVAEIRELAKNNLQYAHLLLVRAQAGYGYGIETLIEDDLIAGEIKEVNETYVLTGGQEE